MAKKITRKKMDEKPDSMKKKRSYTSRQRIPHTRCRVFSRNVHVILKAKGKSVNAFAAEVGVAQPYMNNLLNGKYEPRLGTLFTIADALGAPVEVLIATELDVVKRFIAKLKKSDEFEQITIATA